MGARRFRAVRAASSIASGQGGGLTLGTGTALSQP
jgi:hypothetical protein